MHACTASDRIRPLRFLVIACVVLARPASAQVTPFEDGWIEGTLRELPEFESSVAARVLQSPEELRLQILVAEIDDSNASAPRLRRHGYRVGTAYFYPDGAMHLCAAIAAMQQIERLAAAPRRPGEEPIDLTLDTPLRFEPLADGDPIRELDPTNLADGPAKGRITIGHEIRKMLIVSNDEAFDRLYDFVGRDLFNSMMWDAGLASVRARHHMSTPRAEAQSRQFPEVLIDRTEDAVTRIPRRSVMLPLPPNPMPGLLVGSAHMNGNERVEGPMDFSTWNAISLVNLQDALVKLARPDVRMTTPGFRISDEHRAFLIAAMTQTPGASDNPKYDSGAFPDDSVKYVLPGIRRVPGMERVEVRSTSGLELGFVTENAHVVDPATGRQFFVVATIYTNSDGVLNDDAYDYDQTALPFMAELGEALARRLLATDTREATPDR